MPNRLKDLREARGLSLNALAAKLGTSNQQISHLELGKRHLTVEWLVGLAAALDCQPWDIVQAPPEPAAREQDLLRSFRSMSRAQQDSLLADAAAKLTRKSAAKSRATDRDAPSK